MEECKLCGKLVEKLQKSHFIPKFVYKNMEQMKDKKYRLAIALKRKSIPLSHQITKYHLCKECEDLFNKNGEKFFSEKAMPKEIKLESMPDIFRELTKIHGNQNGMVYYGRVLFNEKKFREYIFYFAVSIFWRATLNWTNYTNISFPIHIEKEMRLYLIHKQTPTLFKIKVDLATENFCSVLLPTKISNNTYIFNIFWYIFTLEINNSAHSIPIKFGRNILVSEKLMNLTKHIYNSTERKGQIPVDLSWLK